MKRAVLLAGHGSARNPLTRVPLCSMVQRLRADGAYDYVGCALWKERPGFAEAIERVEADEIIVVPIFMADGYYVREVLPREMQLDGVSTTRANGQVIKVTRPLGEHPSLTDVLVSRAQDAGAGPDDTVVVLGHGTPRNPKSADTARAHRDRIQAKGIFARVEALFIDQEPLVGDVFELCDSQRIVVVPFFVAEGWHVSETIPDDLGLQEGRLERGGRELIYTEPVGTDPTMVDVVRALIRDVE